MDAKGFSQIEQLFHTAMELDAVERAAYLARECEGDPELRDEVESLIAALGERKDFLETPAFTAGLKALSADSSESLTGALIGSYKVQRLLGKGGMGEVYLAEDTRLGRQVALKFLARALAADNWARRRLIKEAQAVAMLDHPNICAVYGLEEADGHSFIVMQYVEGEALSERAHGGRLDAKQVLSLALQMVSALAEAHAHGIIHRDIKPQNMILTAGGQLKVLDFGLAKVIQGKASALGESQASQNGLIAGTVAYMSPEQLRAERLDYRSDIFSVGIVLYTLTSGKHPFLQESDAATIAATLTSPLPHLTNGQNGFPRGLNRVIGKCLEKDKERRYQSASELLLDLQYLQAGAQPRWSPSRVHPLAMVALLIVLIGGALLAYFRLTKAPSLAVLPFVNESADKEFAPLVAGLPKSVANQMAMLTRVKVKAPSLAAGNTGQQADSLQVGRALGVDAVLTGKAITQDQDVFLLVQLVKTADGGLLWTGVYDLKRTQALKLQELVISEVASSLRLHLSGEEQKLLRTRQTSNTEALSEYWRGLYLSNRRKRENVQTAIGHFDKAIELDPSYARAYTGLADLYILLPSIAYGAMQTEEAVKRARAAARSALDIDDTLPEAHTSLGVIKLRYDWNWPEAEAEFRRAIQLKPDYPSAHHWLSHLLLITGRKGEALAESEIARDLDPFSPALNLNRCKTWFQTRRYDNAARCLNEILAKKPDNTHAQYVLGLVYQEQGRVEQAIEIFQKVYEVDPRLAATTLGYAYGRLGRRAEALKMLAEMEARALSQSPDDYVPPQEFAIVHLGLGDKDTAFQWLDKAYKERFPTLIYLTVEPLFVGLRSDTRFAELARRLNLPLH